MRELTLIRLPEKNEATPGVLLIEGTPKFVTLEDAWLDNAKNISCIPAGLYEIARHNSPKFGEIFEVQNVPERGAILLHVGNTIDNTTGCILLGMQFGSIRGRPCVWRSKEAFELFMECMRGIERATLRIQTCIT